MAIMRLWHGKVAIEKADEYENFMVENSSVEGLQKLYFQRKNEKDIAHFLLVTIWDSLEAVTKFAGDNAEIAKYYPEDDSFLLEKEKYVSMYQIFFEK